MAEYIFKAVDKNGLVRSQDGAAIILALRSLPLDRRPKVSATVWQHGDPLHPSNLMLLSKVLREVQSEEDSLKTTGNFKNGPHFIWMFILQRYVENASDSVPFKSLWDTVVESTVTSETEILMIRWVIQRFVVIGKKISGIPIVFGVSSSTCRGLGRIPIYA